MPSDSSSSPYDPKARPRPHSFYGPRPNRLVIALVQRRIARTLRRQLKVTKVEIADEHLARLKALANQRALLTPSHSGGYEPHVMMYLSRLVGDYFHFVAALEVFEQSPLNRWIMPRLGCYSILRGTVDRQSFSTTRELLAKGERPLVIFPEGEAVGQNAMLMPFQQGVFQLAFKALEDARAEDPDARLLCVPIAIKYVYLEDMSADIKASLTQLEQHLALPADECLESVHARLRRLSEAVLAANEEARGIKPAEGSTMDERIQSIKQEVIEKLESDLDVRPQDRQTQLDRIRALFNAVDRIVHDKPANSPYEQQLAEERVRIAKALYDELWRLLKFVAVYDGYVSEAMTVERFMDILGLLEHEVLNRRRVWGPRKAVVEVGEAVDLADRWQAYSADRREAVAQVTCDIEGEVRQMLRSIGLEHETPMKEE